MGNKLSAADAALKSFGELLKNPDRDWRGPARDFVEAVPLIADDGADEAGDAFHDDPSTHAVQPVGDPTLLGIHPRRYLLKNVKQNEKKIVAVIVRLLGETIARSEREAAAAPSGGTSDASDDALEDLALLLGTAHRLFTARSLLQAAMASKELITAVLKALDHASSRLPVEAAAQGKAMATSFHTSEAKDDKNPHGTASSSVGGAGDGDGRLSPGTLPRGPLGSSRMGNAATVECLRCVRVLAELPGPRDALAKADATEQKAKAVLAGAGLAKALRNVLARCATAAKVVAGDLAAGGFATVPGSAGVDVDVVLELSALLLSVVALRQQTTSFHLLESMLAAILSQAPLIFQWSTVEEVALPACVRPLGLGGVGEPSVDAFRVRIAACSLIRALVLESDPATARSVQLVALRSTTLAWHLQAAIESSPGSDELGSRALSASRRPAFVPKGWLDARLPSRRQQLSHLGSWGELAFRARAASRDLVSLLCANNSECELVVRRALPERLAARGLLPPDVSDLRLKSHRTVVCEDVIASSPHAGTAAWSGPDQLWWDMARCAKPSGSEQKAIAANRIKRLWFGVDTKCGKSIPTVSCKVPRTSWAVLWDLLLTHRDTPDVFWTDKSIWELRFGLWREVEGLKRRRAFSAARVRRGMAVGIAESDSEEEDAKDVAARAAGITDVAVSPKPVRGKKIRKKRFMRRAITIGYEDASEEQLVEALGFGPDSAEASAQWDWEAFSIDYPSLADEPVVDGFYVRGIVAALERARADPGLTSDSDDEDAAAVRNELKRLEAVAAADATQMESLELARAIAHTASPGSKQLPSTQERSITKVPRVSSRRDVAMRSVAGSDASRARRGAAGTRRDVANTRTIARSVVLDYDGDGSDSDARGDARSVASLVAPPAHDLSDRRASLETLPAEFSPSAAASGMVLMAVAEVVPSRKYQLLRAARLLAERAGPEALCDKQIDGKDAGASPSPRFAQMPLLAAVLTMANGSVRRHARTGEAGDLVRWHVLWRHEVLLLLRVLVDVPGNAEALGSAGGVEALLSLAIVKLASPGEERRGIAEERDSDDDVGVVALDSTRMTPTVSFFESGLPDGEFTLTKSSGSLSWFDESFFTEESELAVATLSAAMRACGRLARGLASEGHMQVLILALLQEDHPALVRDILALLRFVLPLIPTYQHMLEDHAFFPVVLLTAARRYDGETSGLCDDAAELLYEYHLCAGVSVEAQILAAAATGAVGATSRTDYHHHHMSNALSSLSAKASSLASCLPTTLVELLLAHGPTAFAAAFNSEEYAAPGALWFGSMRDLLMERLARYVAPLRTWVARGAARDVQIKPMLPIAGASIATQYNAALVPGIDAWPEPVRIRYPELEEEPQISNVFLRVFVASGKGGETIARDKFLARLCASLEERSTRLWRVHARLNEAVQRLRTSGSKDFRPVEYHLQLHAGDIEEYRLCHMWCGLLLRSIAKVIADADRAFEDAQAGAASSALFAAKVDSSSPRANSGAAGERAAGAAADAAAAAASAAMGVIDLPEPVFVAVDRILGLSLGDYGYGGHGAPDPSNEADCANLDLDFEADSGGTFGDDAPPALSLLLTAPPRREGEDDTAVVAGGVATGWSRPRGAADYVRFLRAAGIAVDEQVHSTAALEREVATTAVARATAERRRLASDASSADIPDVFPSPVPASTSLLKTALDTLGVEAARGRERTAPRCTDCVLSYALRVTFLRRDDEDDDDDDDDESAGEKKVDAEEEGQLLASVPVIPPGDRAPPALDDPQTRAPPRPAFSLRRMPPRVRRRLAVLMPAVQACIAQLLAACQGPQADALLAPGQPLARGLVRLCRFNWEDTLRDGDAAAPAQGAKEGSSVPELLEDAPMLGPELPTGPDMADTRTVSRAWAMIVGSATSCVGSLAAQPELAVVLRDAGAVPVLLNTAVGGEPSPALSRTLAAAVAQDDATRGSTHTKGLTATARRRRKAAAARRIQKNPSSAMERADAAAFVNVRTQALHGIRAMQSGLGSAATSGDGERPTDEFRMQLDTLLTPGGVHFLDTGEVGIRRLLAAVLTPDGVDVEQPRFRWNSSMRRRLQWVLAHELFSVDLADAWCDAGQPDTPDNQWRAPYLAVEGGYLKLYPSLQGGFMVGGVYVNAFLAQSGRTLATCSGPSASEVLLSALQEIAALHARHPPDLLRGHLLPHGSAMSLLAQLATVAATLAARVPALRSVVSDATEMESVVAFVGRFASATFSKNARAVEDTDADAAAAARKEERTALRNLCRLCAWATHHPKPGKGAVAVGRHGIHFLHRLLRAEEEARGKAARKAAKRGRSGVADATDSEGDEAAATAREARETAAEAATSHAAGDKDSGDEGASGSLGGSRDISTARTMSLLLAILHNVAAVSPAMRAQMLDQGVVMALLRIAFAPAGPGPAHHERGSASPSSRWSVRSPVRLDAVRTTLACGGAASLAAASRGSGGAGRAIAAAGAAVGWGKGEGSEDRVAAFVDAVLSPMFSTPPYGSRILAEGHENPMAVLETFHRNRAEPLIVWNAGARADVCNALSKEWQAFGHAMAAAAVDGDRPARYDAAGMVDRMKRPTIDGELRVGGVFVRCWNLKPNTTLPDFKAFAGALLAFIEVQVADAAPTAAGNQMAFDREGQMKTAAVFEAVFNLLESHPALAADAAITSPERLELLAHALHPSNPRAVYAAAVPVLSTLAANDDPVVSKALGDAADRLVPRLLMAFDVLRRDGAQSGGDGSGGAGAGDDSDASDEEGADGINPWSANLDEDVPLGVALRALAQLYSRSPHFALALRSGGVVLLLMRHLVDGTSNSKRLSESKEELRASAALLGRIVSEDPETRSLVCHLVNDEFGEVLGAKPAVVLKWLGEEHPAPMEGQKPWDDRHRRALAQFLAFQSDVLGSSLRSLKEWDARKLLWPAEAMAGYSLSKK